MTLHWKVPENGAIIVLNVLVMGPGEGVASDGGTPTLDTIKVIGACLPKNSHWIMVVSHVVLSGMTSKNRFESWSDPYVNQCFADDWAGLTLPSDEPLTLYATQEAKQANNESSRCSHHFPQ